MAVDAHWRDGSAIRPGWIPLEPGVNVLYGLNGAGKSLILEQLAALLTGGESRRPEGMRMELIFQVPGGSYKGEEPGADWGDFVYARKEVAPFLASFERPGEEWVEAVDHHDAEGRGWVFIDDLLERAQFAISESIRINAILPDDVTPDQIAVEVLQQQMFAVTSSDAGLQVRAVPDSSSPVLSKVVQWLEEREKAGHSEWEPIGSVWLSAPEEIRAVLPRIFAWCYQDWLIEGLRIPVMGLPGFEANAVTASALNGIARLHPAASNLRPQAGFESVNALLRLDAMEKTAVSYLEIADRSRHLPWLALTEDGLVDEGSAIVSVAGAIAVTANRYYASLLIDAPVLEVDLGDPALWLSGTGLRWGARRSKDSAWVELKHLSQAEQRWASIAIQLALQITPAGFLILDEPEQALHRSAETHMARGLQRLSEELNLCVVVATHSTEVLNLTDATIHLVRRADQGLVNHQQIHPLGVVERDALREFGLLPSDLLRRQRGLLLVEGEHEVIIWRELLGEQLDELRVELLPLRGAGNLKSSLDSRVLYDFTDAHLFVMLDALNADTVTTVWDEACRLAKTQSPQAAAEYADRELKKLKVDEAALLAAWASRALALGRESRHTPLTLQAADILDYLPPTAFIPNATSWEALRDECARSQEGNQPSGSQFKNWLRKSKGADLSPEGIRAAAQAMDSIPTEFTSHLERMRELLSDR